MNISQTAAEGFEIFKALVALFLTDWVYVEAAYDEARKKS